MFRLTSSLQYFCLSSLIILRQSTLMLFFNDMLVLMMTFKEIEVNQWHCKKENVWFILSNFRDSCVPHTLKSEGKNRYKWDYIKQLSLWLTDWWAPWSFFFFFPILINNQMSFKSKKEGFKMQSHPFCSEKNEGDFSRLQHLKTTWS